MEEIRQSQNSLVNMFGVKEDAGSKYRMNSNNNNNNNNTFYHLSQIALFGYNYVVS